MHRTISASEPINICLLDNDPLALSEMSEILSSPGWKVEPFIDSDTILTYAAMHQPAAAIINFGGSCVHVLDIAAHLRCNFPSTSVIISLKVHRNKAHKVLIGTEMVNLNKRRCVESPEQPSFGRSTFSQAEKIGFDECV